MKLTTSGRCWTSFTSSSSASSMNITNLVASIFILKCLFHTALSFSRTSTSQYLAFNSSTTKINTTDPTLLAHVDDLHAHRAQYILALNTASVDNKSDIYERIQQVDRLIFELVKCVDRNLTQPADNRTDECPSVFDKASCWPATPPGKTATQPCPLYVNGFVNGTAYKKCNSDGTWAVNNHTGDAWTDYRECSGPSSPPSSASLSSTEFDSHTVSGYDFHTPDLGDGFVSTLAEHSRKNIRSILGHIHNFRLISTYGYSISLVSLLVACTILIKVKKLHCPRNSLHLHLFLSFIIRSTVYLIKSAIFEWDEVKINDRVSEYVSNSLIRQSVESSSAVVENITTAAEMLSNSSTINDRFESQSQMLEKVYALTLDNSPAACKLLTIIWQYSLLANYFWVLMEGFYLYNIMFTKIFNDNSNIVVYVVLGWGSPLPIILAWSTLRLAFDDTFCWEGNENEYVFWITRGPITASIIINFYFFIRIAAVIFSKMFPKSSSIYSSKNYKYRSWFKSTLVLMPLFGIHYTFFLFFHSMTHSNTLSEFIWLYIDLTFTTLQGCLVSVLYCFWCADVRYEVKKFFSRFSVSQFLFWSTSLNGSDSSSARQNVHLQVIGCVGGGGGGGAGRSGPKGGGGSGCDARGCTGGCAGDTQRPQLIVDRNGINKLKNDVVGLNYGRSNVTCTTATQKSHASINKNILTCQSDNHQVQFKLKPISKIHYHQQVKQAKNSSRRPAKGAEMGAQNVADDVSKNEIIVPSAQHATARFHEQRTLLRINSDESNANS